MKCGQYAVCIYRVLLFKPSRYGSNRLEVLNPACNTFQTREETVYRNHTLFE
jgi:hypothetical protein